MRDDRKDSYERLIHIQKSILEIESYTGNESIETFLVNHLLSSGVLFQFSVIGEAVIHVEKSILNKYNYPWFKVRALRNLISHEYFKIKLEAVWDIVVKDLPILKSVIDNIIENEFNKT